jgi:hypothetical protein
VSGVAAGSTTITATSEGMSGSAAITVTRPPRPDQVTDLAVPATTASTATLTWTEVDDGTGQPARYDIRYARTPIGWGWGQATVVVEGDCASPVAGVAIGATRTCEVKGLEPATAYDFQMVAFRGTLNQDAVFGPLSTVATGTTVDVQASKVTASVAEVSLTALGQTKQLEALAYDEDGQLVRPSLAWASTDTEVATVSSNGLITARGIGTALVVVSALCCSADTILVSVRQDVTDVLVEPASLSLRVAETRQLVATARDANGFVVEDVSFSWESHAPDIAAVSAEGVVEARAAGSALIIASVACGAAACTGTAQTTVEGAQGGAFPNEPPGFVRIAETSFDAPNMDAFVLRAAGSIVVDPSAPVSCLWAIAAGTLIPAGLWMPPRESEIATTFAPASCRKSAR